MKKKKKVHCEIIHVVTTSTFYIVVQVLGGIHFSAMEINETDAKSASKALNLEIQKKATL